jgi:CRISPR type III-B/RAMP module-associated protein Cmr5
VTAGGVRRVDQHMAAAAGRMLPPTISESLRTRYRQLPVMVRTSGLAATVAFLVAKSDEKELGRAYRLVADGIRAYLEHNHDFGGALAGNEALLTELASMPPAGYARAAAEVELLAGWLSRLAEARFRASR